MKTFQGLAIAASAPIAITTLAPVNSARADVEDSDIASFALAVPGSVLAGAAAGESELPADPRPDGAEGGCLS